MVVDEIHTKNVWVHDCLWKRVRVCVCVGGIFVFQDWYILEITLSKRYPTWNPAWNKHDPITFSWSRKCTKMKLVYLNFIFIEAINVTSEYPQNAKWCTGITGGGGGALGTGFPPDTSDREIISADLPGKERQGKMGKWRRKEGKFKKGRWKIENGRRESYKMRRRLFFFLFFVFCFSLFKTTEICFRSTKMEIFYREKAFHARKKSGKMTLPLLKIFHLRP